MRDAAQPPSAQPSPSRPSPSARRSGPARGTRRAVGGVSDPAPENGPGPFPTRSTGPSPARSTGAGASIQPVPETPEELEDGSQQERWLRAQRPPHWG